MAVARLRSAWYRLGAPYQTLPNGEAAILIPFGDDMKFQNAHKQKVVFRSQALWVHLSLLVPFGPDFIGFVLFFALKLTLLSSFSHCRYSNMDRLIKYINAHFEQYKVHVRYGTLREYFETVNMARPSATDRHAARGLSKQQSTHGTSNGAAAWPRSICPTFP